MPVMRARADARIPFARMRGHLAFVEAAIPTEAFSDRGTIITMDIARVLQKLRAYRNIHGARGRPALPNSIQLDRIGYHTWNLGLLDYRSQQKFVSVNLPGGAPRTNHEWPAGYSQNPFDRLMLQPIFGTLACFRYGLLLLITIRADVPTKRDVHQDMHQLKQLVDLGLLDVEKLFQ